MSDKGEIKAKRSRRRLSPFVAPENRPPVIDTRQLALELKEFMKEPAAPLVPLRELAARFLPGLLLKMNTPHDLEIPWRKHLLPLLGGETYATLTEERAEQVLGETTRSPRTFNKCRWAGRRLIEVARAKGAWSAPNPFDGVKTRVTAKRIVRPPPVGDLWRVLAWADAFRVNFFAACLYLATRRGELFGLLKEDVDLDGGWITITRSHHKNTRKSGRSTGVPIPAELVPFLRAAIEASPSEYVFPKPDGKPWSKSTKTARWWRQAQVEAGVITGYKVTCRRCKLTERALDGEGKPRRCETCGMRLWFQPQPRYRRLHDTRHISVSLHRAAGCDPLIVSHLADHGKKGNMTDDVYTHFTEEQVRENLNRLSIRPESAPETTDGEKSLVQAPPPDAYTPHWTSNPRAARSNRAGRTDPSNTRLWTAKDVAVRLGVCRETVYRLVGRGLLPCVSVGSINRFRPDDVEAFIARGGAR